MCVCVCVFLLCVVSSDVNRHCVGGGTVSKSTGYRPGQRYIRWLFDEDADHEGLKSGKQPVPRTRCVDRKRSAVTLDKDLPVRMWAYLLSSKFYQECDSM